MTDEPPASKVAVEEGIRSGAREAIVAMHAVYYAKAWGFGAFFEAKVAAELADFCARYDRERDRLFLALEDGRIAGSVIVDGGEAAAATKGAHLRWFIVDESHHGRGTGRALMNAAMDFIRDGGFPRAYLTTFAGLNQARALYERAGFRLIEETPSTTWGAPVTEQLFVWTR